MTDKHVLEFDLNDKQILDLIERLDELRESKGHIHYELPKKQINIIGEDIEIAELLIHHSKDKLK